MKEIDLDFDREARIGLPEIIYGEGKTPDQLAEILRQRSERQRGSLVTRLQAEKAEALLPRFPEAVYDPLGRTLLLAHQSTPARGRCAVVSAGTSDLPVVLECETTLRYLGAEAERIDDAGIAGVHRFTGQLDRINTCQVVIVVAGFEGALASLACGLLSQPVIAVPTSVGYGVAEGGKAALNAMLASCANGLVVMNIDNGCGAAMAALRILNSIHDHHPH